MIEVSVKVLAATVEVRSDFRELSEAEPKEKGLNLSRLVTEN